ncbi:prevent-host-death family protein [Asticcacaulis biprosthecium C19]|uniref:Antitoxin n=1 Tax=Asticcacaulis biprosthecium C19 TaxID=715226 RepID=F4QI56_9CAUL|nr:type II toxin-antitoxin system prevent-host-death family antitoxin [Asticcacaulis biprosthecium]EGF92923.1 prevent-host-death family protein [Asticcacaulis biprosthecium C19]
MQVTIHAAKTQLSKLIEAAASGEEVVIARGRTPVARLVPIHKGQFKIGILKDKVTTVPDFLEPMAPSDLDLWEGR